MDVSFLTIAYINKETGKRLNVQGEFSSKEHEHAVEQLTGGKLAKRTPIDRSFRIVSSSATSFSLFQT